MSLNENTNLYTPSENPSLDKQQQKKQQQQNNRQMLFTQSLNPCSDSQDRIDGRMIENFAIFTSKGILIKTNKMNNTGTSNVSSSSSKYKSSNIKTKSVLSSGSNKDSTQETSNEHQDGDGDRSVEYDDVDDVDVYSDEEELETTSLISCITCLSGNSLSTLCLSDCCNNSKKDEDNVDANGNNFHENEDDSVDAHSEDADGVKTLKNDLKIKSVRLPNNSVIPFSKILNCKMVNGSCVKEENVSITSDVNGHENEDNNTETEQYHFIKLTFAKLRRQDLIPKSSILKVRNSEYLKLLNEYQTIDNTQEKIPLNELVLWKSFPNEDIYKKNHSDDYHHHNKRILVIINPKGGKGKANKLFLSKARPILLASGCTIDYKETTYHREAFFFTKSYKTLSKYDIIACASGDGIPHEVLNGIYKRKHDRVEIFNKISITQIPCGSGNAMSVSCHGTSNPSSAALNLLKGKPTKMDLMLITQPSFHTNVYGIDDDEEEPHRVSFLSQAYGVIAESDINTEYLRFMGAIRFEIGVTSCVLRRKKFPCEIFVKYGAKSKKALRDHYNEKSRYVQNSNKNNNDQDDNDNDDDNDGDSDSDSNNKKDGDDVEVETIITTTCEQSTLEDEKELTEEDFKPKYPFPKNVIKYTDDIPEDWEQIDSELTNNCSIFYTGKMPYVAQDCKFFPAALPDDGVMDLVLTDARTSITRTVPILLSLDKGSHVLQPEVVHSKVKALRLIPHATKSVISVDGENFPVEPMQVEVLPRVCKVIMLGNGNFVDTEFDSM